MTTSIRSIPSDKINLRLILVSGKTKEFIFSPNDSAGDIAQAIFDNWPEDWADEAVEKAEILRLIYQGRFLHSNVTLGALGLIPARTTVMHLVPRETLPEPNSQGEKKISDRTTSGHWLWSSDTSSSLSSSHPQLEPFGNTSAQDPAHNQRQKSKGASSSCCSAACTIL